MGKITVLYDDKDVFDQSKNIKFISGYVTNTRLMGVLVVYIKWAVEDSKPLHQFFYFDQEEFGLDTFKYMITDNQDLINETEISLIGGLGAEKVPITEKEATYLVQSFVQHNIHYGIELPEDISKCDFFLSKEADLTDQELEDLQKKTCAKVNTICEAINYFMMRLIGKDYEALKMLSEGLNVYTLIPTTDSGSLLKNTINVDLKNTQEFTCESLIDTDNSYRIVISEIELDGLTVTGYKATSDFEITPQEAALILAQDEFVSTYRYDGEPEFLRNFKTGLTRGAMKTSHQNGCTYLIFNKDNSHVDSTEFRLSHDVLGVYYVSNNGEVIASANTIRNIGALEKDLDKSQIASQLKSVSRFQFDSPVLYSYINSDYKSFEDFVKKIKQ